MKSLEVLLTALATVSEKGLTAFPVKGMYFLYTQLHTDYMSSHVYPLLLQTL